MSATCERGGRVEAPADGAEEAVRVVARLDDDERASAVAGGVRLARRSAIRLSSASTVSGHRHEGRESRSAARSGSWNSSSQRSRSADVGNRRPMPSPRIRSSWGEPRSGISQSLVAPDARPYPSHMSLRRPPVPRPRGRSTTSRSGSRPPLRCCARPAACRRRPRRRRLGEAHAPHPRRHRRSPRWARPTLVADLPDPVRPPARGDGWDVRAAARRPRRRRPPHDAALTDLENGATSLLVQVGSLGHRRRRPGHRARGRAARRRAGRARRPLGPARRGAGVRRARRAARSSLPGRTSGWTRSVPLCDPSGFETLAERSLLDHRTVVAEAASLAGELGCRALVVDGTAVHDLGASDVQELGYVLALGAHYLRALDGRRGRGRRGRTAGRVPARGQRRAVRDDRQAARRTPPVGADARAQRRCAGPPQMVPARRDLAADDDEVRPVGEHAAHLRRCLRRRCGRRRRGDGAPVRLPARAAGRVRRRIARNTSSLLVEESHVAKVADPAGGAFAVEKLTDDLAVAGWEELGRIEAAGGVADGARRRLAPRADRRRRRRARPPDRHAQAAADRADRVPQPARDACPSGRRTPRARCRAPLRRALRGAPRRARRDARSSSRRWARSPPTPRGPRSPANLFAAGGIDVVNEGRHDDVGGRARGTTTGSRSSAWSATTRRTPSGAPTSSQASARPVPQWVVLAGKPVEGIETDDTCAMGVDALDFLHRTREKLA